MNGPMTDQEWDDRIQQLGGGVLQSSAWAKFQSVCSRQSVRGQGDGWAWQAFERRSKVLKYLMAPYGPVVAQDGDESLNNILSAARARRADFVRLEPVGQISTEDIRAAGGRQIHALEPEATLVLDLTKSEEELRAGLSSSHRNRINTALKRGLEVRANTDLATVDLFLRFMHDTARHARITNFPDWYYQRMAEVLIPLGVAKFYVAYGEGQPIGCSLVYDWGSTRYYAHTGNDQSLNRRYNGSVYSVWRMIEEAKTAGLKKFDFWGIAPTDDPSHPWAGITAFKKAFGGEVVRTIGTWDIPVKKTKYGAYNLYRKLRRMD